jgi:exosortase A
MRIATPEMNVVTATASAVSPSWPVAFSAVMAAIIGTLALYWSTAASMWSIWMRADTYAHCFIVPLVAVWLVWRDRAHLKAVSPQPALSVVFAFAIAGFAWLLGVLSSVNALSQFAFMAMIVLTVPVVLGTRVAGLMMFPLCFLLFAVPFGDFLLPQLMDWTAEFTIRALRVTGVPVYREGLNFSLPSGNWSVVEACSGVRYLIASVMAGTLYAYLTYQSNARRFMFVVVAALVPIVANWLRAYMIVLIGHLSSGKLAAGVDHLIYGWLFFGVVMVTMYWIGSHWHEHASASPSSNMVDLQSAHTVTPRGSFWVAAAAVVAIAACADVRTCGLNAARAGRLRASLICKLSLDGNRM